MLLAFDTATAFVSVALHDGTGGVGGVGDADVVAEAVSDQPMRHGEQLAPLIERVLTDAGVTRRELTAIAVGVGPGPFTGLRVGLVTARTLGYVLAIPVRGVCSLDVLAVEAVETGAVSGEFVVATDARRREVYLATYDASGRRRAGPEVMLPVAAATDLPAVGQGATLYPDAFSHPVGPHWPSAGWLARAVSAGRAEVGDPEPLYLRRPDATMPGPTKSALGRPRAARP